MAGSIGCPRRFVDPDSDQEGSIADHPAERVFHLRTRFADQPIPSPRNVVAAGVLG